MKITNYLLRKKVHALAAKAATREHHFCTLEKANSILVLYEAKDSEAVEPCLETLRMMHKQVRSCVYVEGGELPEADDSRLVVSKEKDLDMWYFPVEAVVRVLGEIKADLLIDLTGRDNVVMQYLLLQYTCPFKVGVKRTDLDFYDLAISVTDKTDIEYLFGHILFYLRTIRSK